MQLRQSTGMRRVSVSVTVNAQSAYCHSQSHVSKPKKHSHSQSPVSEPRSLNQQRYIELLRQETPYVVIAAGAAGSGKTMLAAQVGVEKLRTGLVERIVITRPAVSVDESHGFLPGTLEQKCAPWMRPVFDILQKYYSMVEIERMIKERVIEISPLSFMRGRSFENAWIICDEFQNCTPRQAIMVLTRFGEGCKLVITGDPMQHDRGFETNGLSDLMDRLDESIVSEKDISVVCFGDEDVVRHKLIPKILKMYGSTTAQPPTSKSKS